MKLYPFRKFISILTLCLFLCLSGGCRSSGQASFDRFLDDCLKYFGQENYLTARSSFHDPSSYGILMEDSSPFGSKTPAALEEKTNRVQDLLTKLNTYDTAKLSTSQQEIAVILKDKLEHEKEMLIKYPYHDPILGENGDAVSLISSLALYQFTSDKDVEEYLDLLDQVPAYLDDLYEYEKSRNQAGILSSMALVRESSEALSSFLAAEPEENILITSFARRLEEASEIDEKKQSVYVGKNELAVKERILPAYEQLNSRLTGELEYSLEQDSVSSYPSGSSYYTFLLESSVGTRLSPEECRSALLELYRQASEEKDSLYKENPDLNTEYYSAFQVDTSPEEIMESQRQNTLIYFPKIDPVSCSFREMPDALAGPGHIAYYVKPALDAEGSNSIYINSLLAGEDNLYGVLSHEGYPGHLYQTNYFYQTLYHPVRLYLRNEGYDEGWATYAQIFNYDALSFSNKDEDVTKQLRTLYKDQTLMELCISSLSDLYVNYDGHAKEDLVRYLDQYDVSAESAESIYQHVISDPADSLKYSIGYYEILRLLPQDKGDTSILDSHESLLQFGSCPFYILSSLIGFYD